MKTERGERAEASARFRIEALSQKTKKKKLVPFVAEKCDQ